MRIEGRPILDVDLNLVNQGADPIVLQYTPFLVGPQGPQGIRGPAGPPGTVDIASLQALGALQAGDSFLVERDGNQYGFTANGLLQFLGLPVSLDDPFGITHNL